MLESLIKAEKECTEQRDVNPDKVLRPIGTLFKEWIKNDNSTELPHWAVWEVCGYMEIYRGRRGNVLLYQRSEEIKLASTESAEEYLMFVDNLKG